MDRGHLAALALILGLAPKAEATPSKVLLSVHVLASADADADALSRALYDEVEAGARSLVGVALESPERAMPEEGSRLSTALRSCAGDAACIAQRLSELDLPLALLVTEDRTLSPAVLSLDLISAAERKSLASRLVDLPSRAPLVPAVRGVLAAGGALPGGHLTLRLHPAEALASIDGEDPSDANAERRLLTVGPHHLRVEAGGYETLERVQRITADQDETLDLALERSPSILESGWFWASVGLVAATTLTVAIVTQIPRGTTYRYCMAPSPEQCP